MITHNERLKTMVGRAGSPLRRNGALGHELANGAHSQDCACVNCRLAARVDQAAATELQRLMRAERDIDDQVLTGNSFTGEKPLVPKRVLLAGQRQLPPMTRAEALALSGQASANYTDEEPLALPKVVLARRPGRGRGAA